MIYYFPRTSKGVLVIVGVVLFLFSYFFFQMIITWIVWGAILVVILFAIYVVGVRLYRRLVGV